MRAGRREALLPCDHAPARALGLNLAQAPADLVQLTGQFSDHWDQFELFAEVHLVPFRNLSHALLSQIEAKERRVAVPSSHFDLLNVGEATQDHPLVRGKLLSDLSRIRVAHVASLPARRVKLAGCICHMGIP